ncbi:hypothetical protein [Propionispora vibrioides]|uniref:Uncharacterized protein n=1 Tax=Propionispora vibrioides TaxID=112903 RepID=A0A1H8XQC1_9FIRM|nr:hypothetical protein [Propionispora vibrioides]SEP41953.1 hypothetical protein SAMN04490178_12729 [Propionispora vibrioides]
MYNQIMNILKKRFCPWCLIITIVLSYVIFYKIFKGSITIKAIKEIVGFEVNGTIGVLAIIIALASGNFSCKREEFRRHSAYRLKAIYAGFFTLVSASITYVLITVIWGYDENFEVYNSWPIFFTTAIFIYTMLTTFISLISVMDNEQYKKWGRY